MCERHAIVMGARFNLCAKWDIYGAKWRLCYWGWIIINAGRRRWREVEEISYRSFFANHSESEKVARLIVLWMSIL